VVYRADDKGQKQFAVDLSVMAKGVYIVRAEVDGEIITERLMLR
jgi:hypothetical protein